MKIAERGQVTIPKRIRDQQGFAPGVEIDFVVEDGRVVLRKRVSAETTKGWDKWVAHCAADRTADSPESVDEFIEEVRGR